MKSVLFYRRCFMLVLGSVGLWLCFLGPGLSVPLPSITSLKPDVVLAGKDSARITIRGRALNSLRSIGIVDCDQKTVIAKVNPGTTLTVDLPASVLARQCVLRLSPEEDPGASLPLAVADPQIATLPLPPHDPDLCCTWGGQFNRLYEGDQVGELTTPPNSVLVGISSQDKAQRNFVLGKQKVAVQRLQAIPSPAALRDGNTFVYLIVHGLHVEDVRWGPNDVEGFWIGTLSDDGKKILELQRLAEMVPES